MRNSLLPLSLVSTALLACSEPPPPTEVRARITDDLGYVLREGKAAMDGSTVNLPTAAAFGLLTSVAPSGTARFLAPLSAITSNKGELSVDGASSFDPDAIIKTLNEELFTDANYLGDGVYRVPASFVCKRTTIDPNGNPVTTIDPDCAHSLDVAQLRIRVEEDDGLRFWIQIDTNHDEPLGILLRHDLLAVTVNLDEATDAMIALAPLIGEPTPNADLAGQITGSLEILGAAHAKAALTFDRALALKVADQGVGLDGPDAFRFTSAAAHVASIELDGHATKAQLELGLGATTVHAPADLDPPTDLFLAGATVTATFQANTLAMTNISLGNQTTTMSVGGQQALALDLNPNDGRKLNATLEVDPATGSETLSVSPRLELRSAVDHAVLGDAPPVYDVTRVALDGSLRGLADRVEVLSGSFSITTNPASFGFAATAGQCVVGHDVYDPVTYDSYTQYTVGACN